MSSLKRNKGLWREKPKNRFNQQMLNIDSTTVNRCAMVSKNIMITISMVSRDNALLLWQSLCAFCLANGKSRTIFGNEEIIE